MNFKRETLHVSYLKTHCGLAVTQILVICVICFESVYFQYPLSNWNSVLTEPCGQEDGQCDYWELTEVIGLIPSGPRNPQYLDVQDSRVSNMTLCCIYCGVPGPSCLS